MLDMVKREVHCKTKKMFLTNTKIILLSFFTSCSQLIDRLTIIIIIVTIIKAEALSLCGLVQEKQWAVVTL